MRVYEITNPQEQLTLLRTIFDNSWSAIEQQARHNRAATKAPKPKIPKPQKRPQVIPAPPLPKAHPKLATPKPIQSKPTKTPALVQQPYKKPINKSTPMPASLKPLPTSVLSPVNGPDAQREIEWSKQTKPL